VKHLACVVLLACGAPADPADDAGALEIDAGGGAEDCFNTIDDDRDGAPDCADSDCAATATCVPSGAGFLAGVLVEADAPCPPGFEGGETMLHRGLTAAGCEGCECELGGPIDCTGYLAVYDTAEACTADTARTGGTEIATAITSTCSASPIHDGFVNGLRATITASETCVAGGAASVDTPTWAESQKFCRATAVGIGCAGATVCAPIRDDACALAEGAAECAGVEETWYTGFDDQRSCSACGCSSRGDACAGVRVEIGNDWICSAEAMLADGEQRCAAGYSPPARLVGEVVQPTGCDASSELAGDVMPTGESTLCCATE
jgi:hypothetical protein